MSLRKWLEEIMRRRKKDEIKRMAINLEKKISPCLQSLPVTDSLFLSSSSNKNTPLPQHKFFSVEHNKDILINIGPFEDKFTKFNNQDVFLNDPALAKKCSSLIEECKKLNGLMRDGVTIDKKISLLIEKGIVSETIRRHDILRIDSNNKGQAFFTYRPLSLSLQVSTRTTSWRGFLSPGDIAPPSGKDSRDFERKSSSPMPLSPSPVSPFQAMAQQGRLVTGGVVPHGESLVQSSRLVSPAPS